MGCRQAFYPHTVRNGSLHLGSVLTKIKYSAYPTPYAQEYYSSDYPVRGILPIRYNDNVTCTSLDGLPLPSLPFLSLPTGTPDPDEDDPSGLQYHLDSGRDWVENEVIASAFPDQPLSQIFAECAFMHPPVVEPQGYVRTQNTYITATSTTHVSSDVTSKGFSSSIPSEQLSIKTISPSIPERRTSTSEAFSAAETNLAVGATKQLGPQQTATSSGVFSKPPTFSSSVSAIAIVPPSNSRNTQLSDDDNTVAHPHTNAALTTLNLNVDQDTRISNPTSLHSGVNQSPSPGGFSVSDSGPPVSPKQSHLPLPVITVGGTTYAPNSLSQYFIASQTLLPGAPAIQISSMPVSLAIDASIIVMGTNTVDLTPTIPTLPPLKIGSNVYTLNSVSQYVIAGQTLIPGGTITVSGTPISLAVSATEVVIGTSTLQLSYITAPPALPLLTVDDYTLTPNGISEYIIAGQTLFPGALAITVSGTPISLGPDASAIVIESSTIPILPSSNINKPPLLTIDGITYTPNSASDYIIASQTLIPGGPPITVSGTQLSLFPGASDLVIGTSTIDETAGLGGYIWSGIGGVGRPTPAITATTNTASGSSKTGNGTGIGGGGTAFMGGAERGKASGMMVVVTAGVWIVGVGLLLLG